MKARLKFSSLSTPKNSGRRNNLWRKFRTVRAVNNTNYGATTAETSTFYKIFMFLKIISLVDRRR
jgi:hypothetical protein